MIGEYSLYLHYCEVMNNASKNVINQIKSKIKAEWHKDLDCDILLDGKVCFIYVHAPHDFDHKRFEYFIINPIRKEYDLKITQKEIHNFPSTEQDSCYIWRMVYEEQC